MPAAVFKGVSCNIRDTYLLQMDAITRVYQMTTISRHKLCVYYHCHLLQSVFRNSVRFITKQSVHQQAIEKIPQIIKWFVERPYPSILAAA